jgi:hypothetical protein
MNLADLKYEVDQLYIGEGGYENIPPNRYEVVNLLKKIYNTAIEDAYENVSESCEEWLSLRKSWDDKLLSLQIK